jgi:hypothetical protein
MAYIVTGDTVGAAAIDSGRGGDFTLEQALAHACRMLSEGGWLNVAIRDGIGRSISGADLVACCKGEKTLTPDLRAVSD